MSADCPSQERLERYSRGDATADETSALASHLQDCERCRGRVREHDDTVELLEDLRTVVDRGASGLAADPFERHYTRGARVGPYEIQDLLGVGGMARVYRAIHLASERMVALKVLKDEHHASREIRARFIREAQAMSQVHHPNVVHIYPPDQDEVAPSFTGMAMELLPGGSLSDWLARRRRENAPFDVREAVELALDAARGLGAAHSHGLVHRDIKPSNLLLDDRRRVKVSDFGVVQALESTTWVTGTGQQIGTPAYMSPEQCKGERSTPASDVYSLGVTLFELATGRLPFRVEGGSPFAQMLKHISDPAPSPIRYNPDVPPRLADVILQCLEKVPEDRYPDGDALCAALERASRPEPSPEAVTPAGPRKTAWQINAPIIREQLERIPQRSIVGWACRCARRVQCFNDDPRVEQAIAMAESVARGAGDADDRPTSSRILVRMQKLRAASLAAAYPDADSGDAAVAAARSAAAASASASARCATDAAADAVFALENALLAWRAGGRSASALWRQAQKDFRALRAAKLGAAGTIGLPVPDDVWEVSA